MLSLAPCVVMIALVQGCFQGEHLMMQAKLFPPSSVPEADWIRFDHDEIRMDDMLDHLRIDNVALDTRRVALERDTSFEAVSCT